MKLQISMCFSFLFLSTSVLSAPPTTQQTYLNHAINASQTLINDYYDSSTGLFSNKWWNSAVMFTTLTKLQTLSPNSTTPDVPTLLQTIFTKKQQTSFLNGFYDDEGWWALLWITAYDLTGNEAYLSTAGSIWSDMKGGWRTEACGGIWWDKKHSAENAIANVLFLSVSAHLANRAPATTTSSSLATTKATYLSWAQKSWSWFASSGMLNTSSAGGVVLGKYNFTTCRANPQTGGAAGPWTYTQGVIISGLLALNHASPAPDLLSNASAIANATIVYPKFTDAQGIFTEPVGLFDADTAQWKGIFVENLVELQKHVPQAAYVDFVRRNADALWADARYGNGTIGPKWDVKEAEYAVSAPSQGSALAALVAAASV
ncbi:hypothetical protein MMC10_002178 [Thelotrema lepadinum]|nr:hypothetical protein [Thelotrema lepadinum]